MRKGYMKKPPKKASAAGKRKSGSAGKLAQPGSHSLQARYILRLYVSGSTLKSALPIENISTLRAGPENARVIAGGRREKDLEETIAFDAPARLQESRRVVYGK